MITLYLDYSSPTSVGFFVSGMMGRFRIMIAMINSLLNWVIGILFLLAGLVNLLSMDDSSKEDFIAFLIIALIGLYFLPPVRIRLKSIFGSKNQTNTMFESSLSIIVLNSQNASSQV